MLFLGSHTIYLLPSNDRGQVVVENLWVEQCIPWAAPSPGLGHHSHTPHLRLGCSLSMESLSFHFLPDDRYPVDLWPQSKMNCADELLLDSPFPIHPDPNFLYPPLWSPLLCFHLLNGPVHLLSHLRVNASHFLLWVLVLMIILLALDYKLLRNLRSILLLFAYPE